MVRFLEVDTRAPKSLDKKDCKKETEKYVKTIAERQKILYAQGKYSLLIILQGLDASGKDGLVSTVVHGINPLGCNVIPFKAPSTKERSYDFLWRVHRQVPPKGQLYFFNRSHYEDVLVPKVEKWVDDDTLERRYKHINNFEQLLLDTDTIILKFYLHISREEQHERLMERRTNPVKFWKHSDGDWETSKQWDSYMVAYQQIFEKCAHPEWNIIPADQNWYKEYLVSKKIAETLTKMNLEYPALDTNF